VISKKQLAIFSPLPPTKSGISDYSIDLGLALSESFNITYVIDENASFPNKNLIKFAEIIKLTQWNKRNKKDYLIFYQMGNNLYHNYIYDEIIKQPGFVLLHDYSLHHLVLDRSITNPYEYKKLISENYINYYEHYFETNIQMPDIFKFIIPLNETIIEKSSGVIVHSKSSFDKIKEKFPRKSLLQINFPVILNHHYLKQDLKNLRNKYKLEQGDFIISSFGFVTPPKQIPLILNSLSLIKKELTNIKYLIVGEVHESINIKKLIEQYQLTDIVKVIGYTDLLAFEEYIKLSDLIITLRYPSAGETSAVLLRALAYGKANIVFDYDSFGDFPDDILLKIPLNTYDPFSLAESIKTIYMNQDLKHSYEINARDYIRSHHDIEKISEQLTKHLTDSQH
jgi:glycosyltransferase involved in cell wall biosynthesis